MLQTAIDTLNATGCTLAVVTARGVETGYSRGVTDLLGHYERGSLRGASVADKIVGKAAAALMTEGGVAEVYTRVITTDAIKMLREAGVKLTYDRETEFVANRDQSGRCPLDTLCSGLTSAPDMVAAIRTFLSSKKS